MHDMHVSEALFSPVTQAWGHFTGTQQLQLVNALCRIADIFMNAEGYVRAAWRLLCTTAVDEALQHSWPIRAAVSVLALQYCAVLQDSVLIGSRLDASQEAATCRLAFYGRLLKLLNPTDSQMLQQLKIYKLKQKQGSIDRISSDGTSAVCKGMFKKETDLSLFSGMQVWFLGSLTATCITTP